MQRTTTFAVTLLVAAAAIALTPSANAECIPSSCYSHAHVGADPHTGDGICVGLYDGQNEYGSELAVACALSGPNVLRVGSFRAACWIGAGLGSIKCLV